MADHPLARVVPPAAFHAVSFRQQLLRLSWLVPLICLLLTATWLAYSSNFMGGDAEVALAAAAALLLGWLVLFVSRANSRLDFFEPVAVIFVLYAVFFPIRVLLAVLLNDPLLEQGGKATFTALFAALLGFACFALGSQVRLGAKLSQTILRFFREWEIRRVNLFALVLVCAGVVSWATVRYLTGSLLSLVLIAQYRWDQFPPWFFYVEWGALLPQVGALFQLVAWLRYRQQPVFTAFCTLFALISSALISRLSVAVFVMMVLLVFHYLRRRLTHVSVLLAVVVFLFYLSVAGLARSTLSLEYTPQMTGWSMLQSRSGLQDTARLYLVQGFDYPWWLGQLLERVPADLPYQYGSTFLPVLAKPIPRSMWRDKPMGAALLFSYTLYPQQLDRGYVPATTAMGEWYLNFSWPGIFIGMLVMGLAGSFVYTLIGRSPEPAGVLLYAALMAGLLWWYRNELSIGVTWAGYYLVPIAGGLCFVAHPQNRKSRTRILRP